MSRIQRPRGTEDVLLDEAEEWEYVEKKIRDISKQFNYKEIRTPVFESTDVFLRGVGDTTDIVQKEMYTFLDRGGRSLTLRPEGTAGVVRSYIENKMYGMDEQLVKLFYFSQMFRYERPEKGRLRQLNQYGIEVFGKASPALDAEVISKAVYIFENLGVTDIKLVINSLGDNESRRRYLTILTEYLQTKPKELCNDCKGRIESNPLRVLDCKRDRGKDVIKQAPRILEYISEDSLQYYNELKIILDGMGIEYKEDDSMVRGLDYYNDTVFEVMTDVGGKELTLIGGGRYSGLVEQLGGPDIEGIGFGLGMERLLMVLKEKKVRVVKEQKNDLYIITAGKGIDKETSKIVFKLRKQGVTVEKDYLGRKIGSQFKAAERYNARYVVVIGERELETGKVVLQGLESKEKKEINIRDLGNTLKKD